MRKNLLMAGAMAAAAFGLGLPAYAESASSASPGAAQNVEPGKVGPGSENNAVVSPTSPDVPISKQPPPEISPPTTSGASTGEKGSGPEATTPPHNPSAPGLQ